ncbi:MAG: complex I subunit 1/NuoH family protein [Polyangiales bacterium]
MKPETIVLLAGVVKVLIVVLFVVNISAILTWQERRQMAMIQDRIGPHRANITIGGKNFTLAGLLHPLADGIKFFFKEDFVPPNADKLLHGLAPILSLFPPICLMAVVPFMDTLCLDSVRLHGIGAEVARFGTCAASSGMKQLPPISGVPIDINVGILYVFALAGMGIIGATIAGWSSDNKFSLLGGLRAASQLVSYEVAMGLSVVGCMMVYGSLRLDEMAKWQGENVWGVFVQPLGFLLFMTAAVAETKRTPFDMPEGESEIVAGYFLEYSSMKFSMFMVGEYIELAVSSGLLVALFLGGYNIPFLHRDGITLAFGGDVLWHKGLPHLVVLLLQFGTFFGKVLLVTWFQIFLRWTLPRFRYDQLMKLGWRMLLPACLANIFITGVALLAFDRAPAVHDSFATLGDALNWIVLFAMLALPVWLVTGMFSKSSFVSRRAEVAARARKTLAAHA